MNVPDFSPEFAESTVNSLTDTLHGICNESTLSRAEILGALEAVKLTLFSDWRDAHKED